MQRVGLAWFFLVLAGIPVVAGGFPHRKGQAEQQVPPTPGAPDPRRLVTPNGLTVPVWATRRIESSPVPLAGKSWGRRPWAYALSNQRTPSAYWARLSQNGFGAGPVPGFSNGPPIGNVPSAPVGPDLGISARQRTRALEGFRYATTGN